MQKDYVRLDRHSGGRTRDTKPTKKRSKSLLWLVGALVLLVISASAVYFKMREHKSVASKTVIVKVTIDKNKVKKAVPTQSVAKKSHFDFYNMLAKNQENQAKGDNQATSGKN